MPGSALFVKRKNSGNIKTFLFDASMMQDNVKVKKGFGQQIARL